MTPASRLTDLDLRLYLSGALPPGKRLLFMWALALDPALRARLAEAREADAGFRRGEMRRLRQRLFPAPRGFRPGGTGFRASPSRRAFASAPALAGALCALVFAALLHAPGMRSARGGFSGGEESVPKGRALGVNLFVKGDSAYRVERQAALIHPGDTLQVVPVGTGPQHLVLLGWDARQGLVRLFPRGDGPAPRVSRAEPPPALLTQDMADNRLICVTATDPFTVAQAEAALREEPFRSLEKAPASHLGRGLYVQVFSIAARPGRI